MGEPPTIGRTITSLSETNQPVHSCTGGRGRNSTDALCPLLTGFYKFSAIMSCNWA